MLGSLAAQVRPAIEGSLLGVRHLSAVLDQLERVLDQRLAIVAIELAGHQGRRPVGVLEDLPRELDLPEQELADELGQLISAPLLAQQAHNAGPLRVGEQPCL